MSTQYLSMAEARALIEPEVFEDFCLRLEEYGSYRGLGIEPADAAKAAEITPEQGERFEALLSTLLAVLKSETAPAATGAVTEERNHSS